MTLLTLVTLAPTGSANVANVANVRAARNVNVRRLNVRSAQKNGLRLKWPFSSACSQVRKYREDSKPDAELQLIAPPPSRELFKSRLAKARNMNVQNHPAATRHCQFKTCPISPPGCIVLLSGVFIALMLCRDVPVSAGTVH